MANLLRGRQRQNATVRVLGSGPLANGHRRGRDATRDIEVDYDEHSAVTDTGREHEAAGVTAVMVSLRRGLEQWGRSGPLHRCSG